MQLRFIVRGRRRRGLLGRMRRDFERQLYLLSRPDRMIRFCNRRVTYTSRFCTWGGRATSSGTSLGASAPQTWALNLEILDLSFEFSGRGNESLCR